MSAIHHSKEIVKRWLYSCLLFFMAACQSPSEEKRDTISSAALSEFQKQMDTARKLVKNGDIIFRNGTDEVSRAARSMNRLDTTFSHCGFVLVENDSVFVYHAIGGIYNPSQRLRRDPIDSFCIPPENDRFAIYRYDLQPSQKDSLVRLIRRHYEAGLKFDMYFNFLSDDEMYCSEFVFKCLNRSLSDSLSQIIRAREWPYGISPDDLFLNERSRLIKRVDFLR
jgi:hypothetical protein